MNFYSHFSQHIVYPFYERVAGRRFLDKLAFLEQSQWWDRETLRQYQWKKIKAILNFAFKNNSFYRKRFDELDVHPRCINDFSDVAKIPILTKDDVNKNLPDLISSGHSPKTLVCDNTSGSTGRNLIFYNDRNTLDWMTAAVLRNMAWYNVGFGDKRIILWGSLINDPFRQRLYMKARNFLLREQLVSSYELDAQRLALLVSRIRSHKPKALIGYVSALEILAQFIQKHGLHDVRVPAVVPAAETLFEDQRQLFENAFHGEVFNRYGCHEFNGIAHECSAHDGMHINAETVYVEVLKNGRPAAPGEIGEIVITDLENFGAPFIRYRMEDLGALKEDACRCGRGLPLLKAVEGRVYDLVSCPNGTIQTGTFFCKITRSVEGIEQFQVIQESKERIRLKLVTNKAFHPDSFSFLRNNIKLHCGQAMDVVFDLVKHIETLKSGKRRYIISLQNRDKTDLPGLIGSA